MQMYEKTRSARRMFTYFVLIDVVPHMGQRKKKKKRTQKRDEAIALGIYHLTTRRHQRKLKPRQDRLLYEQCTTRKSNKLVVGMCYKSLVD
jgi:hypothetical protein